MNAAGYVLGAIGVSLLLSPTGTGLRLLLGSGLRGLVWVAVWWPMVGIAVNILNRYAPAHIHGSLEQIVNPLLAMLSWLVAYPLCLLLRLSLRLDEGLIRIVISITGTLTFWRVVIYDTVAESKTTFDVAMVFLTFTLSLLLMVRTKSY